MRTMKQTITRKFVPSLLDKPVGILSTGIYIPSKKITNQYWTERVDTSDEWIINKTGIRERRFSDETENTSDMLVKAALNALEKADITSDKIDVIIVGTFTPDYPLPSTALIVKEKLKATNALPIDLSQTACAGLIYGLHLGTHLLQNPSYKNILVLCGDSFSKIINPQDRTSSVLVGDAAGGLILRRLKNQDGSGILSWDLDSKLSLELGISHGGTQNPLTEDDFKKNRHKFFMNGKEVWNQATTALPTTLQKSLNKIQSQLNCAL